MFRGLLLYATLAFSLHAQTPDNRYQVLKEALGLSDAQLTQLQQMSPAELANDRPAVVNSQGMIGIPGVNSLQRPFPHEQDPSKYGLLDASQKAKLDAAVVKVWLHQPTARLAIAMDLTSAYQWPGYPCPHDLQGTSDLELTSSQRMQLEELRQSTGQPQVAEIGWAEWRRNMSLNFGWSQPPVVMKAIAELPALRERFAKRRDLALAILDDSQKAKLAEFETALQLLSEARELRLISALGGGEALCQ